MPNPRRFAEELKQKGDGNCISACGTFDYQKIIVKIVLLKFECERIIVFFPIDTDKKSAGREGRPALWRFGGGDQGW